MIRIGQFIVFSTDFRFKFQICYLTSERLLCSDKPEPEPTTDMTAYQPPVPPRTARTTRLPADHHFTLTLQRPATGVLLLPTGSLTSMTLTKLLLYSFDF